MFGVLLIIQVFLVLLTGVWIASMPPFNFWRAGLCFICTTFNLGLHLSSWRSVLSRAVFISCLQEF